MTVDRKKLGASGEELAAQFLMRQGYRILARNLKLRYGEVDVLALDGLTLVIVEVKTKASRQYGLPAEMVTPTKQRKLRLLAQIVASQYNMVNYRIDVVAIDWSTSLPRLEHYRYAF